MRAGSGSKNSSGRWVQSARGWKCRVDRITRVPSQRLAARPLRNKGGARITEISLASDTGTRAPDRKVCWCIVVQSVCARASERKTRRRTDASDSVNFKFITVGRLVLSRGLLYHRLPEDDDDDGGKTIMHLPEGAFRSRSDDGALAFTHG